jgi:hypothetical protein
VCGRFSRADAMAGIGAELPMGMTATRIQSNGGFHMRVTPLNDLIFNRITIQSDRSMAAGGLLRPGTVCWSSSYTFSQVRSGLAAGGRWIRTLGPPPTDLRLSRKSARLLARDRDVGADVSHRVLRFVCSPVDPEDDERDQSAHNQSDMSDRRMQIFGVDKSAEITVN